MKEENKNKCEDRNCPFHGKLSARGRHFKGTIKKIVGKRAVLEFERMIHYKKYERFAKAETKLHAYIPDCLLNKAKVGSIIKISECRPLSKIIHFVVIEIIKENKEEKDLK